MNDRSAAAAQAAGEGGDGNAADIEAQAREQGWRPESEYEGKGKWVPADEYLKRAEPRYLRERLRTVDDQLETSRTRQAELERKLAEVTSVLSEYSEHSAKVEERVYARARREILAEMEQAVEHGDVAAFKAKQTELDNLEKPSAPAPKKPAADDQPPGKTVPKISAVAQRWVDDPANKWFHTNARMNAYATAAHGENMRDKGMSEAESLAAVSKEIREQFPEHFENAARRAPGSVAAPSGGSNVQPKKTGKTYDDLPADAKKACDRFVTTIPNYTREKYVAEYDWSGANVEE